MWEGTTIGQGGRDDVANAVAGAIVRAGRKKRALDPKKLAGMFNNPGQRKLPAHSLQRIDEFSNRGVVMPHCKNEN